VESVELDDDVFAALQSRARPFKDSPSDVIRALLKAVEGPAAGDPTVVPSGRPGVPGRVKVGRLRGLIDAGLISEGDELVHERKRSGEVFKATVSKDGCIVLPDGRRFREPSPALREYTRSQIDGWANWTHVPSGRKLRDLRDNG
jgi:hypothetical protein